MEGNPFPCKSVGIDRFGEHTNGQPAHLDLAFAYTRRNTWNHGRNVLLLRPQGWAITYKTFGSGSGAVTLFHDWNSLHFDAAPPPGLTLHANLGESNFQKKSLSWNITVGSRVEKGGSKGMLWRGIAAGSTYPSTACRTTCTSSAIPKRFECKSLTRSFQNRV